MGDKMMTMIKDILDRVQTDLHELCEELRLHRGEARVVTRGLVTLRLEWKTSADGQAALCGSVLIEPGIRERVGEMPWHLADQHGQPVADGWTNTNGHFTIWLDAHVRSQSFHLNFDRPIPASLKTLGLFDRNESSAIEADPPPQPIPRLAASSSPRPTKYTPSRPIRGTSIYLEVLLGESLNQLPEGEWFGLSSNRQWVILDYPSDQLEDRSKSFPYRTALIELCDNKGEVVAAQLVPAVRNDRTQPPRFQGRVPIKAQLPTDPEQELIPYLWQVRDDMNVLSRISLKLVEEFLDEDVVASDPDVQQAAERLAQKLETQE